MRILNTHRSKNNKIMIICYIIKIDYNNKNYIIIIYNMQHQDWQFVIFKKKTAATVTEVVKTKIHNPIASGVKLDENDEVSKIKYVPKEISNEISQARNLKNMTQKQLALGLNLKPDIINNIESGKAIYNGEQIARIRRQLGLIR